MPEPDYRNMALTYLDLAGRQDGEEGRLTPSADGFRQAGLVWAVLAVADELRRLREEVSGVASSLTCPHEPNA
ncbi:hypothetical protein [Micromonospora sp. I033]